MNRPSTDVDEDRLIARMRNASVMLVLVVVVAISLAILRAWV